MILIYTVYHAILVLSILVCETLVVLVLFILSDRENLRQINDKVAFL